MQHVETSWSTSDSCEVESIPSQSFLLKVTSVLLSTGVKRDRDKMLNTAYFCAAMEIPP